MEYSRGPWEKEGEVRCRKGGWGGGKGQYLYG